MAEGRGYQSSEGHRPLCANNCGFFGSPATQNFCSKCYRDFCMKDEDQSKPATSAIENSLFSPEKSVPAASSSVPELEAVVEPEPVAAAEVVRPSRCAACRKRVGLMGFICRCGTTFCGTHRYPEQHGCEFDFKGVGRVAIAKANPLVKAEKLEKI